MLVWLLVIAGHLLFYYLFITGKVYQNPALLGVNLPYPLLHGPFLYLYTSALTNKISTKKYNWLLHFLAILPFYVYLIPFFSLTSEKKIEIFQNNGAGYELFLTVISWSINLSGIIYVSAALYLLHVYRKSIKNDFSYIEKINLSWLRFLIYGVALIWLFVVFEYDNGVYGLTVVYVFFLGYFGIKQVGIFSQNPDLVKRGPTSTEVASFTMQENESIELTEKIKYAKSTLTKEDAIVIHNALQKAIHQDKIYANPEITLSELANILDVHPNNLSQVINSFEQKNFYDYINEKRVEAFITLVSNPKNHKYTLLALAYDCGFNSKPSFNRNFKKVTGLSPTAYIKQLEVDVSS